MKKLVDRFPIKNQELRDINLVRAGYQNCVIGYRFGPTTRNSWTIQYIHSGCGIITKNGRDIKAKQSECFVLRPGEEFILQADTADPWLYTWIGFTADIPMPDILNRCDVFDGTELEKTFIDIAKCNHSRNYPIEMFLTAQIWSLIFHLERLSNPERYHAQIESYVDRACAMIADEYATISVKQLSDRLKLDRCYLSKLFKKTTGTSPQLYINYTRLQNARELLLQGKSITQISTAVGYSDIACFSRAFKEYYKCSPKQYIKMQGQNKS